jgi:hypothetical protein
MQQLGLLSTKVDQDSMIALGRPSTAPHNLWNPQVPDSIEAPVLALFVDKVWFEGRNAADQCQLAVPEAARKAISPLVKFVESIVYGAVEFRCGPKLLAPGIFVPKWRFSSGLTAFWFCPYTQLGSVPYQSEEFEKSYNTKPDKTALELQRDLKSEWLETVSKPDAATGDIANAMRQGEQRAQDAIRSNISIFQWMKRNEISEILNDAMRGKANPYSLSYTSEITEVKGVAELLRRILLLRVDGTGSFAQQSFLRLALRLPSGEWASAIDFLHAPPNTLNYLMDRIAANSREYQLRNAVAWTNFQQSKSRDTKFVAKVFKREIAPFDLQFPEQSQNAEPAFIGKDGFGPFLFSTLNSSIFHFAREDLESAAASEYAGDLENSARARDWKKVYERSEPLISQRITTSTPGRLEGNSTILRRLAELQELNLLKSPPTLPPPPNGQ